MNATRISAWWAAFAALVGCGGSSVPRETGTPNTACDAYPANAVRPMEVGAVLYPYAWPVARNLADQRELPLDLGKVPCATDPDIDWSPFDVLLFISVPAY
jgi:hypothetical protein